MSIFGTAFLSLFFIDTIFHLQSLKICWKRVWDQGSVQYSTGVGRPHEMLLSLLLLRALKGAVPCLLLSKPRKKRSAI